MRKLDENQMRLLALLEEAGDEEMGTLLNQFARGQRFPELVDEFSHALGLLLDAGYIQIATRLDERLYPTAEPQSIAAKILDDVKLHVLWSEKNHWDWTGTDMPTIVATEAGIAKAQELLRVCGWNLRGSR